MGDKQSLERECKLRVMGNNINNSSMLKVGTVLHGTYRIDGYLSSGGFGNTYVATNIEFDEKYAIKEFFMRGVSQRDSNNTTVSVSNADNEATFESQREKFKKEARRLRKLQSNHIVKVYDLFEENGTAYYVMDYIDGENLSERLKRTGTPLAEEEVLRILPQILDALEAAHKEGIWHLDLKPANIMLDKIGVVKLIDFGASKQQSATGGATTSTAVSYTNGYAPREQMEQNLDKFGPWADFYALGATLYNLLTNKKPPLPSDIDDDTTSDKHLALSMPNISDKTKKLVLWLMETNRKNRPQSVKDIKNYLSTHRNDSVSYKQSTPSNINSVDTGDDETLLAGKTENKTNVRQKETSKPQVTYIEDDYDNPGKGCIKWIVIAIVAVVVFFIIIVSSKGCGSQSQSQSPAPAADSDTTAIDMAPAQTSNAEGQYVEQHLCKVSQGNCTYTGYVNEDGVPNGEGEAMFSDDRYYKGNFDNGMMVDGDAYFKFPNGDYYEGSFIDDHFSKGRYTVASDKSYFIGTYDSNGQPKKGAWYDKNGRIIQNV